MIDPRALNQLYMAYLEHSIRYYEMDAPLVSDDLYDRICKALLRHWPGFRHHLKRLTDEEALRAGSGYHLVGDARLDRVRTMMAQCPPGQTMHDTWGTYVPT